MSLDSITSELVKRLGNPAADRAEALETFLGSLLSACLGWRPRATDGMSILREELDAVAYFAVGTLHLIDDQSRQPVMIELSWSVGSSLVETGVVRVGMAADANADYGKHDKLESALLAYPREMARELSWRHSLHWANIGWESRVGRSALLMGRRTRCRHHRNGVGIADRHTATLRTRTLESLLRPQRRVLTLDVAPQSRCAAAEPRSARSAPCP